MPLYLVFGIVLFNIGAYFGARLLLSLYALNLGAQPVAVGLLAATFSAAPTLLSWVAGRVSDRFGSRLPIMISTAVGAAGMAVPYFVPGLPALYVAAAFSGLWFAFSNVSTQNLVGSLSKPEMRSRNYTNFTLVGSFAMLLGPIFTGYAIDHAGHRVSALSIALLALVPLVALLIWGRMLPGATRTSAPSGSLRDALAAPGLVRAIATSSLVVAGMDLFQFYLPIYGHSINMSASSIGIVLAVLSGASIVSRVAMPKLIAALGEERLLAYSFFAGALSFAALPFFENAVALTAVAFVFGAGMGFGAPITMMLAFSRSAAGRSGEALGLRLTVNHLTRMVGPILFGSIGSAFGLFAVFWGNALLLAAGGTISLPKKK